MKKGEAYLVKSLAETFELKWHKPTWHVEDGLESTNSTVFPTIYECESAFSPLLAIKPKARNRLDAIYDKRVALSKTEPCIGRLIAKEEVHPSH